LLPNLGQRPGNQILLKEGSQCLNRGLVDGFEETTECAPIRQLIPSKQSHKRGREGEKPFVERLESGFTTEAIADKDDQKIDGVINPETCTSKANTLCHLLKQSQMGEVVCYNDDLPHP
jgi:hypothetical protein